VLASAVTSLSVPTATNRPSVLDGNGVGGRLSPVERREEAAVQNEIGSGFGGHDALLLNLRTGNMIVIQLVRIGRGLVAAR